MYNPWSYTKKSVYDELIRNEYELRILNMFIFHGMNPLMAYKHDPRSIIPYITHMFVQACEEDTDIDRKNAFHLLRHICRDDFNTFRFENIFHEIYDIVKFKYTQCSQCHESMGYCDMNFDTDIRVCRNNAYNRYMSSLAWDGECH